MTDKPVKAPEADKNSPTITVGRDVHVGQIGDTYIIQSKPPTASFVGEPVVHKRDDGTVSLRMMLRLSTQHPPNAMVVAVRKEDVVIFGDMRKLGIEVTRIGRTEFQTGEKTSFI